MNASHAVVLAGGLGNRLRSVTGDRIPKVMTEVGSRPFLDYKMLGLARLGISDVHLLIGHRADQIRDHVGDGSRYGLCVTCIEDGPELLGTGGAVRRVLDALPDAFWLTYGDTHVVAPLAEVEHLLTVGTDGVMTVIENADRWEPSNVSLDGDRVATYAKSDPTGSHRWLDYGLLLFRRAAFEPFGEGDVVDLRDVVDRLVAAGRLAAWPVTERFWDIGTPEVLAATEQHFADTRLWERLQA